MRVDLACPNMNVNVQKLWFHSMPRLNNFIYLKSKAMFEISFDLTKQISNILRRIEHFRLPGNSIFKQFSASRYLDTSIKKRKYMYLHNVKIQMRQETSIPGIIRWITCARNYRTSSKSWEPYRLAYVQPVSLNSTLISLKSTLVA